MSVSLVINNVWQKKEKKSMRNEHRAVLCKRYKADRQSVGVGRRQTEEKKVLKAKDPDACSGGNLIALQWKVCHAKKTTTEKQKKGKADLTTVLHIRELPHLHMKLAVWFSFPTTKIKIQWFLPEVLCPFTIFLQPRPNLYQELRNIGARNMLQNFYMWHDIFASQ